MTREFGEDMQSEMPRYLAKDLRNGILDMIEWATEDGLPYWEIYGVISGLEKYLELVMKADLLSGLETEK